MELSWRTLLIFVVLILIVIVIVDGLRRMRRDKYSKTGFDLNQEFDFPKEDPIVHEDELIEIKTTDNDDFKSLLKSEQENQNSFAKEQEFEPHFSQTPYHENDELPESEPEVDMASLPEDDTKGEAVYELDDSTPEPVSHPEPDSNTSEEDVDDFEFLDPNISEALKDLSDQLKTANQKSGLSEEFIDTNNQDEDVDLGELEADGELSIMGVETVSQQELEARKQRFAKEQIEWEAECESLAQELNDVSETLSTEDEIEALNEIEIDDITYTAESDIEDSHIVEEEYEIEPNDVASALSYPVNLAGEDAENLANRPQAEVVISLQALSRSEEGFSGKELINIFNQCDLRFGEMDIFHRFEQEQGAGCIQFSIAQSHEPGVFDPNAMASSNFPGLTFFMSLPGASQPLLAYKAMSEMAQFIAKNLEGDLLDETRSAFTAQTCEHQREQIIDYQRKQKLEELKHNS